MAQLAEFGAAGISVNAIAKAMGLTGPALYRYFACRDALLTDLIADAYTDLADAVEAAADRAARRSPKSRVREMAEAFRVWAIAEPHRYLLLFGTPVPGYRAPDATADAAHRTLAAFARAFADIPETTAHPGLDRMFATWLKNRDGDLSPSALRRAVAGWTRMHGVLSLEVEGQFEVMGLDGAQLYRAEVDAVIDM
ncbi:TetR/AcrR family transcriptional regulator [Actinokineospora sp.]|uniref:TetR/AcrR family transcriptional regulator n=1 Tax=Actinokineospora sp. TaxID=1872133 RepID=UPI0040379EB2